jgi:hypothetical protein
VSPIAEFYLVAVLQWQLLETYQLALLDVDEPDLIGKGHH